MGALTRGVATVAGFWGAVSGCAVVDEAPKVGRYERRCGGGEGDGSPSPIALEMYQKMETRGQ